MRVSYLLGIPILAVMILGAFLGFYLETQIETDAPSALNLIKGGSPIKGSPDAPITILEWGDYQCTFCYKFHQDTLGTIQKDFIDSGKVKLVFKDYPLNGPDSFLAAEASYCAEDQGKYWQYHDQLYQNWGGERTGWITRESLDTFAGTVNLELQKFNKCLDNHKYQNKVNAMYQFGKEIGIDATPSFLVFNEEKIIKIRGSQPLEVFLRAFDEL